MMVSFLPLLHEASAVWELVVAVILLSSDCLLFYWWWWTVLKIGLLWLRDFRKKLCEVTAGKSIPKVKWQGFAFQCSTLVLYTVSVATILFATVVITFNILERFFSFWCIGMWIILIKIKIILVASLFLTSFQWKSYLIYLHKCIKWQVLVLCKW